MIAARSSAFGPGAASLTVADKPKSPSADAPGLLHENAKPHIARSCSSRCLTIGSWRAAMARSAGSSPLVA